MHLSTPLGDQAAIRSKTVALSLLIYCLLLFQNFVGALCWSLFCYAVHCFLSSFAINVMVKRELVA